MLRAGLAEAYQTAPRGHAENGSAALQQGAAKGEWVTSTKGMCWIYQGLCYSQMIEFISDNCENELELREEYITISNNVFYLLLKVYTNY